MEKKENPETKLKIRFGDLSFWLKVAIILIFLAFVFGTLFDSSYEIDDLQNQIEELQSQIDDLQYQVEDLEFQINYP